MIAVPMDAGRRYESGQPVEELERGEPEHGTTVGRGRGQAIEDLTIGLPVAPLEPLQRERRPGTVAEQSLEAGPVVGFDADRRVEGEAPGVFPGEHLMDGRFLQETVAPKPPQDPAADGLAKSLDVGPGESGGLVEPDAGPR